VRAVILHRCNNAGRRKINNRNVRRGERPTRGYRSRLSGVGNGGYTGVSERSKKWHAIHYNNTIGHNWETRYKNIITVVF